MPLANLYNWFLDSTALKHFTEAAPGFEELMCLGKLYDLVTDSKYDLVVFDAPSTGHAALMLRVPRTTGAAVRTGPLHHNALKIQLMLENDMQTRIVIVALAEEMAIREALELANVVRGELAMHLGPMIVNRVTRAAVRAPRKSTRCARCRTHRRRCARITLRRGRAFRTRHGARSNTSRRCAPSVLGSSKCRRSCCRATIRPRSIDGIVASLPDVARGAAWLTRRRSISSS